VGTTTTNGYRLGYRISPTPAFRRLSELSESAVSERPGGLQPVYRTEGREFESLRARSRIPGDNGLIITSNKPFSAWGEIFGDDAVAVAMIDRLVHHAKILSLKDDSYRLKGRDLGRTPRQSAETP